MYEADPRHVELLAKSLGLENCKPVATPGLKVPFVDEVMDLPITNEPETISSLPQIRKTQVRFSKDKPTEHLVTAYSNVYGVHPSRFVFNIDGRMIRLKPDDDRLLVSVLKS